MAIQQEKFDSLLKIQSRAELREQLNSGFDLTLPQAQQLTAHARSLAPAIKPLRLGIVHTFTSDLLDTWLDHAAALEGLELNTYHASYGVVVQEAHAKSGLTLHAPDATVLLLQREDMHPDLAKPLAGFNPEQQLSLRQESLAWIKNVLLQFRAQPIGLLIVSFLPPVLPTGPGLYDAQSQRSETAWWSAFKGELAEFMRSTIQSSLLLDMDEVAAHVGRGKGFFDWRMWYSARYPFAVSAARELARRIVVPALLSKHPKAKVIVLDADNTLWGGIIGEDGMHGIALGPEYPGNAYMDFQRRLLDFQQRGFVLAMCSKNNAADVQQVLTEHPHQLLRESHFAAKRVNWLPKPDNIRSLAQELNLGLDSFIFVDDSEHECAAVRSELPQVEVIRTPAKPILVPSCLDRVARLEVLSITAEDLEKTALYAQERQRKEFQESIGAGASGGTTDMRAHLAALGMRMNIGIDDVKAVARLAQLTQKTNQFNLTTHRYDERQVRELIDSADWVVAHFTLIDKFGNSGIVGLALFQLQTKGDALLETFLMSCRVIGREAESAFLHSMLRVLKERGVKEVRAAYAPTAKNGLVAQFLPEQGFEAIGDGHYKMALTADTVKTESAFPIVVQFDTLSGSH